MTRGAVVVLDPELFVLAVGLIKDHGLQIKNSLDGRDRGFGGKVVLVIAGDRLPEECESVSPPHVVKFLVTDEHYGSQHLTRITDISVDVAATERFISMAAAI